MSIENKHVVTDLEIEDRQFEVAHAQGNGFMAREAAGIDLSDSDQPDYSGFPEAQPDYDELRLVGIPAVRSTVVNKPARRPRPLGWRERRRA